MDTVNWEQTLVRIFPRLSSEGLRIVEEETNQYNCIAYAVGDKNTWWWPNKAEFFWPPWSISDTKIESLEQVFDGLGYEKCEDHSLETGYEKVALYEKQGLFTHASLQMASGHWRSKLGIGPLIEHLCPESLTSEVYGKPTIIMRRHSSYSLNPE
ncbi:MAG: hypothetical protein OXE78_05130 [Gammaproteobacteria bacterium]|nr:hypothetical protein [Gammaproteobacteria bacterium]MCY4358997.1 hypothetical protein [Gammaproteobacteria bacterium]